MFFENHRKLWWHLSDEELRIFATLFVIQIPAIQRESVSAHLMGTDAKAQAVIF